MTKYMILIVTSLWVAACAAHDERYYRLHPVALQKAMEACPNKAPKDLSCERLNKIAIHVNELAYQLRSDPQGYGKGILALQELIAKEQASLKENTADPSLSLTLADNQRKLENRLAIVKWLESPES